MTETNKKTKKKASFKKTKEEPKVVEVAEPVDLPVNMGKFEHEIGVALTALRDAKTVLGTSVPYQDFVEELEYANEALVDLFQRVQQLNDLEEVLSDEQFTTQPEVDAKIRKKVIEAITKKFKFVKEDEKLPEPDLIVVPDQVPTAPAVEKPQPEPEGPSRSLSAAADNERMRRAARQEAVQELDGEAGASAAAYEKIFNAQNSVVEMEGGPESYDDGVTQEDVAAFFGEENVDAEILAKAESLKAKVLKSGPAPVRGKNKGISRSS